MDNFLPYGTQWIDDADVAAVTAVLRGDFLTQGPAVEAFEAKLAAATGARHAIAVSNGTAALHLAALALLERGDRVLTTPNSFVATANAILYAGGVPVFADIAPDGNLDLDRCGEILSRDRSIKGLFGVHFSGKPLDQDRLGRLRETYGLKILEDCAHAIGGAWAGGGRPIRTGSCAVSDAAILSFHPVKHVTTGEGGAVTTNDDRAARQLRKLRSHGIEREVFVDPARALDPTGAPNPWYYEMTDLGFNYRLCDLQAALGSSQLDKLERFLARRRELARHYGERFAGNPLVAPLYPYDAGSAYHLYVVRIDFAAAGKARGPVMRALRERGIGTQVHYLPVNRQPYYRELGYGDEPTPVMDRYYEACLSLPLYPRMELSDADRVVGALREVLSA